MLRIHICTFEAKAVLMSLTRRRVPLFSSITGWPDHERVPSGPSARQDACRLPQLQVSITRQQQQQQQPVSAGN